MKVWRVMGGGVQAAVIAPTRGKAKELGLYYTDAHEFMDLRCYVVDSPTPVTGLPRVLDYEESFAYGVIWACNDCWEWRDDPDYSGCDRCGGTGTEPPELHIGKSTGDSPEGAS